MDRRSLYDEDVYAWAKQQADALRRLARTGRDLPNELDLENVAEAIEDVGKSELSKVESFIRLVCRERSIVRGDGGRFTTPPPSRLEARSRLGDKAANELGAPAVSSIPARLPGPEPASARKGREDDRAVLRWNRRVAGP